MQNTRKFWSLALSLTVPAFAAVSDTGFSDVAAGDWFAQAAVYVRDNGVMNGTSATTFGPNATMTRGMLATVLYRAAGSPAVTDAPTFPDVPSDSVYHPALPGRRPTASSPATPTAILECGTQ